MNAVYNDPTARIINVASVPQRSPFRYPGGKTWLVPYLRLWLRSKRISVHELAEPFAGGAIIGLTAAFEGLANKVTLVELDPDVASVWRTILGRGGQSLAERIASFKPTADSVKRILNSKPSSVKDRAFATILRNRVQRGGILAPGAGLMKYGENGKGLTSRWYPATLQKRILDILRLRDRIRFIQGDGLTYIEKSLHRRKVTLFIDPPYTIAGRRLYRHSDIDHEKLFALAKRLAGDFLMTYDDSSEIRQLIVRFRFDCETVAMKNTHNTRMTELLIGPSLEWLRTENSSQQAFAEFLFQTPQDSRRALR